MGEKVKLGLSLFWRAFVVQVLFAFLIAIALHSTPLFSEFTYVKWKPTVMFGMYAAIFIVWRALTSNGPLHMLWGKRLQQSTKFWRAFTLGFAGVCGALALLNLVVAYFATTEFWVSFKTLAPIPLELLFCLVGAPYFATESQKQLSPA